MSISISAVALLNGHININDVAQHLARRNRVYKIQAENGQGQNKQQYSIVRVLFFREGNVSQFWKADSTSLWKISLIK